MLVNTIKTMLYPAELRQRFDEGAEDSRIDAVRFFQTLGNRFNEGKGECRFFYNNESQVIGEFSPSELLYLKYNLVTSVLIVCIGFELSPAGIEGLTRRFKNVSIHAQLIQILPR